MTKTKKKEKTVTNEAGESPPLPERSRAEKKATPPALTRQYLDKHLSRLDARLAEMQEQMTRDRENLQNVEKRLQDIKNLVENLAKLEIMPISRPDWRKDGNHREDMPEPEVIVDPDAEKLYCPPPQNGFFYQTYPELIPGKTYFVITVGRDRKTGILELVKDPLVLSRLFNNLYYNLGSTCDLLGLGEPSPGQVSIIAGKVANTGEYWNLKKKIQIKW